MKGSPTSLRLAIALLFLTGTARADDILVFAAASLTDALGSAAERFEADSGHTVTISFAGSSVLARQIEAGAPADIFVSANTGWMDRLEQAALIDADSRIDLLGNALVVVAPASTDETLETIDRLGDFLGDGRLAIADPDHVPAGIYAQASLEWLGLWPELSGRTARTADVRGALALVERGEVPAGIVYRTDAEIVDGVRVIQTLPAESHPPIVYPAALTAGAGPAAGAFLDFLQTGEAAAIFTRFGFIMVDRDASDPA